MKKVKINEILFHYELIKDASIYQVQSADDRRSLLKNAFVLKGVIDSFEALKQEAINKHKGKDHDEIVGKFNQWRDAERDGKEITLTPDERNKIAKYVRDFESAVSECLAEDFKKEHELEIRTISEDSFDQFIADKPWTIGQIMTLHDFMTD